MSIINVPVDNYSQALWFMNSAGRGKSSEILLSCELWKVMLVKAIVA